MQSIWKRIRTVSGSTNWLQVAFDSFAEILDLDLHTYKHAVENEFATQRQILSEKHKNHYEAQIVRLQTELYTAKSAINASTSPKQIETLQLRLKLTQEELETAKTALETAKDKLANFEELYPIREEPLSVAEKLASLKRGAEEEHERPAKKPKVNDPLEEFKELSKTSLARMAIPKEILFKLQRICRLSTAPAGVKVDDELRKAGKSIKLFQVLKWLAYRDEEYVTKSEIAEARGWRRLVGMFDFGIIPVLLEKKGLARKLWECKEKDLGSLVDWYTAADNDLASKTMSYAWGSFILAIERGQDELIEKLIPNLEKGEEFVPEPIFVVL